ncbi:probable nucleoredoxin 2 [Punica granatum]|uniref:protein-disulfide reductase n=1 Tax=Punica granatum TaxID=22663 RepID=A0A6P8EEN2_PUNGR|nr:probable nucleoredoxin 2 [Punica granatum]
MRQEEEVNVLWAAAGELDRNHDAPPADICGGSDSDKAATADSSLRLSSLLATKDRDYLLSPSGAQVKVSDLEGHVVGLYFSANWYQPCRNFTEALLSAYEQLRAGGSNFEVVFVSADEDLDAFNHYRSSMPWLSIPYSDLESKKALNRKFDVEGIPCLIILQLGDDKDMQTLHDGVELIYRYGARAFPFTAERLEELQKEEQEKHDTQSLMSLLTNHDRDYLLAHPKPRQVPVASLTGKTVGLFFSAQWCLPGAKFTPKLISMYHKIKQMLEEQGRDGDFEIVYISSDRDESSFQSDFDPMPWLALPFGDQNAKALAKHFDVWGIPWLVILGPDGKTVTTHGRSLINLYREKAYPFTDAKLEQLQKEMDEEAKNLPRLDFHAGHRHELTLVSSGSGGGPFICCDCEEQGSGWAYQCLECGYEVHTKCMRSVGTGTLNIERRFECVIVPASLGGD